MHALSPIGSSLLLFGAYVISGGSRYMVPGGGIALAGLLVLALAVVFDPAAGHKETEIKSVRSRRGAIGEAAAAEPSEEMDQATA